MKHFAILLFAVTASAAPTKSHDIFVNGKFLISSYNVGGRQLVALDDVRRVVSGRLAVQGGRLVSSPPEIRAAHGLFVRKNVVLGNVIAVDGRQWLATAELVQQLGGASAVSALNRLGPAASLQIAVFDCPDVRCCPDCGIALR
jgi:hypothetical protein